MTDESPAPALDANLSAAVAAIEAEAAMKPAPVAPDYETIARRVRAEIVPSSPISGDPVALVFLDLTFIPALVAALQKGT